MTAITQALSVALLHFVWQGLLVVVALWAALFILRNRSANVRYAASCAALALLAALPVVTACVVYRLPAAAHAPAEPVRHAAAQSGSEMAAAATAPPWIATLERWALPAWSLGVLLFSLRLVWASRQIARLRKRGRAPESQVLAIVAALQARIGLARPVRVLLSAVPDGPSVVGWIRPVVLLPAATVLGLTPQQLEAVLAHELAHILRRDHLVNMLQTLVETLLFYHPAVWWTSARIRQEREMCCDDLAVACCGDAVCYARALTRLERLRVMTPRLALGSTDGPLFRRIQRLVGAPGGEYGPSKLPGILALALGLICLGVNLQWARGQQPETRAAAPGSLPGERGVQVDLGDAAVIHRAPVEYPRAAAEKHIQGTVVVEVTLDASGMVSDARVLSGPAELRRAALESVLRWHFTHEAAGDTRQVGIAFQAPAENVAAENLEQAEREHKELAQAMEAQARAGKIDAERAELLARKMRFLREQQDSRRQAEPAQAEAMIAQKLAMEKMLADAQGTGSGAGERYRKQAEELQRRLEALQAAGASREQMDSVQADAIKLEKEALDKRLAEMRSGFEHARGAEAVAGRTLKSITVRGLTEQLRSDLVSRLPVHLGDTLDADSMRRIEAAVRQFDEHLEFYVVTGADGQVELGISAPDSGGWKTPR